MLVVRIWRVSARRVQSKVGSTWPTKARRSWNTRLATVASANGDRTGFGGKRYASTLLSESSYKDVFEELRADGFTRVRVDGEVRMLEEEIVLDKKFKHTIEVVVDRLVMKPDLRTRLVQSADGV